MKQSFNIFDLALTKVGNIEDAFQIARINNIAVSSVLQGSLREELCRLEKVSATGFVPASGNILPISGVVNTIMNSSILSTIQNNHVLLLYNKN